MAKKPEMTPEQKALLIMNGYQPAKYEVLFDFPKTMIIRSIDKKEAAVIYKS